MNKSFNVSLISLSLVGLLALTGCDGDDDNTSLSLTREHDQRAFSPAMEISFDALDPSPIYPDATQYYGIYDGLQGEAVYTAEIPEGWDGGGLVMYTHGFRGEGATLDSSIPNDAWRAAVLAAGYAWAASSYSANFYDVRAGIEDTNKLALNLTDYLVTDWGIQFETPSQYLISGFSLGGHVAAAAVERENMERTLYPVPYAGSAPMCQSEQNEFQWLGDYPRAMMELAGFGDREFSDFQSLLGTYDPTGNFIVQSGEMIAALFEVTNFGTPNWANPINENGERLVAIVKNLTGGERPIFEQGFNTFYNDIALSSGGADGTVTGILTGNIYDNSDRVYRWTDGDEPTAAEVEFNEQIRRASADDNVNPRRNDGVRWIPLVEGDFDVPVLTMHTLGDVFVPFVHQQLYREGAIANGNDDLLVQRAIRAPGHCEFSGEEIFTLLSELIAWVNFDIKPNGDEVLDSATVADDNYGCNFTNPERDGLPSCIL